MYRTKLLSKQRRVPIARPRLPLLPEPRVLTPRYLQQRAKRKVGGPRRSETSTTGEDIDFLPKKGKTKKDLLFRSSCFCLFAGERGGGRFFFVATFFSLILSVARRIHINLFRVVEGNAGIGGEWLVGLFVYYIVLFPIVGPIQGVSDSPCTGPG